MLVKTGAELTHHRHYAALSTGATKEWSTVMVAWNSSNVAVDGSNHWHRNVPKCDFCMNRQCLLLAMNARSDQASATERVHLTPEVDW